MRSNLSIKQLKKVKIGFNNILFDLRESDIGTFIPNLEALVDYCERTVPISSIVENYVRIIENQFNEWYKDWDSSDSSDKKNYTPIPQGEIGNAMIYEFLNKITNDEIDLRMFCQDTMNLRADGPMKRYLRFYDLFIDRLVDDINRKLDDQISEHQTKELKREKISFWTTIPGILTGITSVIAAITALYIALNPGHKDTILPGAQPALPPSATTKATSPSDWPLIAEETFTKELLNWNIGNFPTEETPRFDLRLVDGKYRWDIEYNKNWERWVISPFGSAVNFNVAVDVKLTEFTSDASVKLLFGSTGNKQYEFSISSNSYFGMSKSDANNTQMIVDWTPIPDKFEPNVWNRMSVMVDEQLIRFYLNSELLGEYRDIGFTGGKVGLGVAIYQKGLAVIDFDNFQFRRKP